MSDARKRYAVLVGQADESYQERFMRGFLRSAFANNADVCVFSMYVKYQDTAEREQGDSNIYSLMPTYRTGKKANMLIRIVRQIDEHIKVDCNWKWAHAMKVMMDAKIIMTNVPNKFDALICWMIPGKGKDNVRKSGNYCIIDEKRHWRDFCDMPNINYDEYMDREV